MNNENSLAPSLFLNMEKEGQFTAKKVILQISLSSCFSIVLQKQKAEHSKKWWEITEDTPQGVRLPVMLYSL